MDTVGESTGTAAASVPVRPALWRAMLFFTLPSLGSSVLQTASTTMTSIYLGQLLGMSALAAVSSFFPFNFFLISFVFGLSMASSVLIAQAHGAGEPERVRAVAGTTLTIAIFIGVVLALLGVMFARPILAMARTPPDILDDAVAYARVILLFQPIVCVFLAYTTFLRGTGDARTPFFALLLNTVQTLLLTPAFILGWGGLPRMGVASGAAASIVAYVVTLVLLAAYLIARKHPLAPTYALLRHMKVDPKICGTILKLGLPTASQMMLNSFSQIAVLSLVNGFGSVATAAYGAVNQVTSYVQMPAISVGIATSIFGAQAIGRGEQDRIGRITRTGLLLNLSIGGCGVGLVYLGSRPLMGLFLSSPDTVEVAHGLLGIVLWSYLVFGANAVIVGMMRASGTVWVPMLISVSTIWLVQVPAAYLLSRQLGLAGIWYSYPINFVAIFTLQSAFYLLIWRHRRVRRLI
jgi:putative MATE family efflux protein